MIQAISAATATAMRRLFAMAPGDCACGCDVSCPGAGRAIGRIGGDSAEMIVAKGNPKGIAPIDHLVRIDLRTSMPNPVSEGIMQFYAR